MNRVWVYFLKEFNPCKICQNPTKSAYDWWQKYLLSTENVSQKKRLLVKIACEIWCLVSGVPLVLFNTEICLPSFFSSEAEQTGPTGVRFWNIWVVGVVEEIRNFPTCSKIRVLYFSTITQNVLFIELLVAPGRKAIQGYIKKLLIIWPIPSAK